MRLLRWAGLQLMSSGIFWVFLTLALLAGFALLYEAPMRQEIHQQYHLY